MKEKQVYIQDIADIDAEKISWLFTFPIQQVKELLEKGISEGATHVYVGTDENRYNEQTGASITVCKIQLESDEQYAARMEQQREADKQAKREVLLARHREIERQLEEL